MPLTGLRVVELAQIIAGPFVGEVMADLGADVIKVERPEGGDDCRNWTPPEWHGASPTFHAMNRNKRSVTIDLSSAEGREQLFRLVEGADIFVQNLRPGVTEKLGLGPEAMLERNPRLVYCDMGAFGHLGPKRHHPGFEILFQAYSGLMANTGEPDRDPVRMGAQICDFGTGLWTAFGALAALRQRDRTGKGVVVNTSLLETALYFMSTHFAHFDATGKVPQRHPTGSPRVVVFQAFQANNGPIMITAATNRLFAKLGVALGRPEWGTDQRFATNADRMAHKEELLGAIQDIIATDTKEHWMDVLEANGVPCAPVYDLGEAVADPQVQALGMVRQAPDIDARFVMPAVSFDGERPAMKRRSPQLGEHNQEVLGAADAWARRDPTVDPG